MSDVVLSEFPVAVPIGPIQLMGCDLNFTGLGQSSRKFSGDSERARLISSGVNYPGIPAGGFLFPSGGGANVRLISERGFKLGGVACSPIFAIAVQTGGSN